jgi:hypothetical protein
MAEAESKEVRVAYRVFQSVFRVPLDAMGGMEQRRRTNWAHNFPMAINIGEEECASPICILYVVEGQEVLRSVVV